MDLDEDRSTLSTVPENTASDFASASLGGGAGRQEQARAGNAASSITDNAPVKIRISLFIKQRQYRHATLCSRHVEGGLIWASQFFLHVKAVSHSTDRRSP